jgi:hypothetical protein
MHLLAILSLALLLLSCGKEEGTISASEAESIPMGNTSPKGDTSPKNPGNPQPNDGIALPKCFIETWDLHLSPCKRIWKSGKFLSSKELTNTALEFVASKKMGAPEAHAGSMQGWNGAFPKTFFYP